MTDPGLPQKDDDDWFDYATWFDGKVRNTAAATHTHPVTDMTATGAKSSTTFLRGDNTWAVPAGSGSSQVITQTDVDQPAMLLVENVAGSTAPIWQVQGKWNGSANPPLVSVYANGGVYFGSNFCGLTSGTGSPEGVIYAAPGSLFLRDDTGQIYKKTTVGGTTNTGWAVLDTVTHNTQTGTSYTLVLADAGKVVEMNNAAANTLTIPANSTVAYPVGTYLNVRQIGAGQTTFAAAGGVTLRSRLGATPIRLAGQWTEATLTKRATDEWVLSGEVTL